MAKNKRRWKPWGNDKERPQTEQELVMVRYGNGKEIIGAVDTFRWLNVREPKDRIIAFRELKPAEIKKLEDDLK